jgi:hypothetical protein
MTCTIYCLKIEEIFDAMIRLSYEVLPENRRTIHLYMNEVWYEVTMFVQSIQRDMETEVFTLCHESMGGGDPTQELMSKFKPYVEAEEKRLLRNLEVMNYRIDGPNTVRIISGEGRIEMVSKAV